MNASTMNLSQAESFINGMIEMGRYNDQLQADYENKMGAFGADMWAHRFDNPEVIEAVSVMLNAGKEIPLELGFNQATVFGQMGDQTIYAY